MTVATSMPPDAPAAFHVMAKPTGAVCNLDCEYCFFLSKEMLYAGSRFRMAGDLQEAYIRQLLEAHRHALEEVVAWQGASRRSWGSTSSAAPSSSNASTPDPPAHRQRAADERDAARRRVGSVPQGERVPRRHLDRRAARASRSLPRRQGRQADLRPRRPRARQSEAARGRLEHAHPVSTPRTATTVPASTASSATSSTRGSCC